MKIIYNQSNDKNYFGNPTGYFRAPLMEYEILPILYFPSLAIKICANSVSIGLFWSVVQAAVFLCEIELKRN